MTGVVPEHPHMSEFTFWIFKDSGWYDVDFSLADPLSWGKNKGCDFVNKEC
jgi:leishmanolysin-like peptidase